MSEPFFLLYEHATGYGLFKLKEFEDVGQIVPEVAASVVDRSRFASIVQLIAFMPFADAIAALANCNAISEGTPHDDLITFLETSVPKLNKSRVKLGVSDGKLAAGIAESLPHILCQHSGFVPEVMRGIRQHLPAFIKGITAKSSDIAQLGLGHSYSRSKVKFNVHRVDNMIIQSISLLDQLDKDINTFSMRIREWYSYHFPELYKCVPDQFNYARCVGLIRDRKDFDVEHVNAIKEIVEDDEKVAEIVEAARTSMGMDISDVDLMNIERFATRVIALGEYRKQLQGYLRDRMASCAPSLSTLIGEQVGARLISHAGSLTNLAKYPASTIQILGAEKALFRALKTRGNTPKYGLLFHSTFIGRAQAKNKGRISRYLANKCALASRIDCFSEVPVDTFGTHLKQQVEDRLKFFETGEAPRKNVDVMHDATLAATVVQTKVVKKRRKAEKKKNKEMAAAQEMFAEQPEETEGVEDEQPLLKKSKKTRKRQVSATVDETEAPAGVQEAVPRKRKKTLSGSENALVVAEVAESGGKKKKKKKKKVVEEPE